MRLFVVSIAIIALSCQSVWATVTSNSSVSPAYQLIKEDGHEIHVLEVDPKQYAIVSVTADKEDQHRSVVSALVKKNAAIAGVNGGFFHLSDSGVGSPAGALKINHEWYGIPIIPRGAIGWGAQNNKVLVDRILTSNKKVLPHVDTSLASKKLWQQFPYIVGGIPLLIKNGKVIKNHSSEKVIPSFLNDRHARTAVCIKKDQHWIFLVASHTKEKDRAHAQPIIEGLTIAELQHYLLRLGCHNALNLDGGGSSTFVLNNKVMNQNAGDMDPITYTYHERPVVDAILIK